MSTKRIIISDLPGTHHALSILEAIKSGYNYPTNYPDIDISGQIVIVPGILDTAIQYAKADKNIIALVRSYSGIKYAVNPAKEIYPRVQTFMPMGNNNYIELPIFEEELPPVICTCGAGDNEGRNNTAYGNGLEFWDGDWGYNDPGQDISSYANGWIAGKMLRFYDIIESKLDNSFKDIIGLKSLPNLWWLVRHICRTYATRTEPNRPKNGQGYPALWHKYNGFGYIWPDTVMEKIETELPLMLEDLPEDPYMKGSKIGDISNIGISTAGAVRIEYTPVLNAKMYVILRNNEIIEKTDKVNPIINNITDYGYYKYSYYAIGDHSTTKESKIITVKYSEKGVTIVPETNTDKNKD